MMTVRSVSGITEGDTVSLKAEGRPDTHERPDAPGGQRMAELDDGYLEELLAVARERAEQCRRSRLAFRSRCELDARNARLNSAHELPPADLDTSSALSNSLSKASRAGVLVHLTGKKHAMSALASSSAEDVLFWTAWIIFVSEIQREPDNSMVLTQLRSRLAHARIPLDRSQLTSTKARDYAARFQARIFADAACYALAAAFPASRSLFLLHSLRSRALQLCKSLFGDVQTGTDANAPLPPSPPSTPLSSSREGRGLRISSAHQSHASSGDEVSKQSPPSADFLQQRGRFDGYATTPVGSHFARDNSAKPVHRSMQRTRSKLGGFETYESIKRREDAQEQIESAWTDLRLATSKEMRDERDRLNSELLKLEHDKEKLKSSNSQHVAQYVDAKVLQKHASKKDDSSRGERARRSSDINFTSQFYRVLTR
jgi:hypothetical protein